MVTIPRGVAFAGANWRRVARSPRIRQGAGCRAQNSVRSAGAESPREIFADFQTGSGGLRPAL